MDWKKICQMMRHANRQSEMAYQKYIEDVILGGGLGWEPAQITEQMSLQLGSTERIVPDLLVRKDERNSFIVEVKKPDHVRSKGDIEQLLSYMKQLEIPVGLYWGDEVEVYWKTIGDGSSPILLLSLNFNVDCEDGDVFVTLFSEDNFSLQTVKEYKDKREAKLIFETEVKGLLDEVEAPEFQETVKDLITDYLIKIGHDERVVETVMGKVTVSASSVMPEELIIPSSVSNPVLNPVLKERRFVRKGNKVTAQSYAYDLICQIIEKNNGFNFEQLFAIFGRKNRIQKLSEIRDERRWFLAEEDIITLSDGTKVAISNQWGFNNHSKPNMDNLRSVAERFGIDVSLPE